MNSEVIVDWLLKRQLILIGFVLAAVIALGMGIPKLAVSDDTRSFFSDEQPEMIDLRHLDNTYTFATTILVMVRPPQTQTFSVASLEILREMESELWLLPHVIRVDSPFNYTSSKSEGDDILIEPLLDEGTEITPDVAMDFRDRALASTDLRNRLLSPSGHAFGMALNLILPRDQDDAARQVATALKDLRNDWADRYPEFQTNATSGILGTQTLARAAIQDITYLIPISFLVVVGIFVLALGSLTAVISALCALFCCVVAAYGFAGWTGISLTAGTAISPLSVVALVSASCVHITISWMLSGETQNRITAIRTSLVDNIGPVLVTNLTTAFGFLCLNFASSPPLRGMGNIVAFALIFGVFVVFTIFPFLLRMGAGRPARRLVLTPRVMDILLNKILSLRILWLWLFPVAVVVSAVGVTQIEFDDNITRYFDSRYEFRRDSDAIQANLTGLDSIQLSLRAPEGKSIYDPDFLKRADAFGSWLATQDNVDGVSSVVGIIKNLHKALNEDDPAFDRVADTIEANAQLMLLYEFSLPPGLDLNATINADRTETLLSASIRSDHSRDIRRIAAAIDGWLVENDPDLSVTAATGGAVAFANLSKRNNSQMVYGLIVVLCLVSLTMVIVLRSVKFGFLSLIPNIVPAVLAFGAWWLMFGDVNLGSTIVTTMTFGIVVDDTIHFLMHYRKARRRGADNTAAIFETFQVVGSAIIITSLALIGGFAVMTFSGFVINQHVGLLTVFVIGFALLADLLLFPAVLITFGRKFK